MKDYTSLIKEKANRKREEEQHAKEKSLEEINILIDEIMKHENAMNTLIKNANELINNGFRWKTSFDYHGFTEGNFYSDGIKHRLGFSNNKNDCISEISVIGGGANGNISIRYCCEMDEDIQICNEKGNACYQREEIINNKGLTEKTIYHLKRFKDDLPLFERAFEDYILSL